MTIELIGGDFTICKISEALPSDFDCGFFFLSKTNEETSLVCPTDAVPECAFVRDDGWRAFRIKGELDFSLTGILSGIASLLSGSDIPLFAVSTFNTDYFLIKTEYFEKAIGLLQEHGYEII